MTKRLMTKCQFYSANMLSLSVREPFAEGGNRLCFVHPDDQTLCIKISKPGAIEAMRAKKSFLKRAIKPRSAFDDNLGEYRAYQQSAIVSAQDKARLYAHIPRCYGWQNTDRGLGLVSDYYADESGQPCPTLRQIAQKDGLSAENQGYLADLANYLREVQVLTKNIVPHNVVLARDGRLKIIDGLGASSTFNPARFSASARRKYIERRIKRMYLRMDWEVSDKKISWEDTESRGR